MSSQLPSRDPRAAAQADGSARPRLPRPAVPARGQALGCGLALRFGPDENDGFCPLDGGRLELSGVLRGRPSLASSAATRSVNIAIWAACDSTSVIRSSLHSRSSLSRSTHRIRRSVPCQPDLKLNADRAATRGPEQLIFARLRFFAFNIQHPQKTDRQIQPGPLTAALAGIVRIFHLLNLDY